MKKFFAFFKKHYIITNLILIVFAGCILVALTFWGLGVYTLHGEEEEVPNVQNMDVSSAITILEGRGLQCEVVDSIFHRNARKGAVVEQYPKAGSMVKAGRKIYLTINARSVQMVALPQARDLSVRQARVSLESAEFVIDSVVYKPSQFRDLVLAVYCNGKEVRDGERLPINSHLVIWAGNGGIVNEQPRRNTNVTTDNTDSENYYRDEDYSDDDNFIEFSY